MRPEVDMEEVKLSDLSVLIKRGITPKYVDVNGDEHPYLSENEFNCFSVVKGNLTDAERKKIQGHIHGTKKLLTKLPPLINSYKLTYFVRVKMRENIQQIA